MFFRRLAFIVFAFLFAQSAYSDQIPKYDRDLFGGWTDTDSDCQNMRHELLQKLSTTIVSFSQNTCRVIKGRWLDPYTDKIFFESRQLDIDHLVPLKYGWDRGAHSWTFKNAFNFRMTLQTCLQSKKAWTTKNQLMGQQNGCRPASISDANIY